MKRTKVTKGFTLIELMIVVAIIGIIAAIAYPSYMESVRKSNRSDAKVQLTDVAQRLQRCYTTYSKYNHADCGVYKQLSEGDAKIVSREGFYGITLADISDTTYTLTATPEAGKAQENDAKCTTLTLTNSGVRDATGSYPEGCW